MLGYLEWGKDKHLFLFQAEAEIISRLFTDPKNTIHPFTILPMVGQILLLVTLFQPRPGKILTITSICLLGLLLGFMFIIGLLGRNYKILLSVLPFLIMAGITLRHYTKPPKHG